MTASETYFSQTLPPNGPDRRQWIRRASIWAVGAALLSVTATFLVLTGLTPIAPTNQVVRIALAINACIVGILLVGVAWEVHTLWRARRAGRAGARLHVRILALFSLMAVLPAALVAVVAVITLNRGLDRWFEERTRAIVDNSLAVADAYVEEHARVLRGDLIAMAHDVDRARQLYVHEPARFDQYLQTQASLRLLPKAFLLNSDGTVVTRAIINPDLDLAMPPAPALERAEEGNPVMIAPGDANQVGGIIKLKAYEDLYLYIARPMDPEVLEYLRLTEDNAEEYTALDESRLGMQVAFAFVYAGVTLVLLVSAIWLGFGFANRLVTPIRRLIDAADEVSHGNLAAEVPINQNDGDLAHLGETFNTMTTQLRSQRSELLQANEQIDQRRRFTEAVLAGVTVGVLGIEPDGTVSLANRSALEILQTGEEDLIGKPLREGVPELAGLMDSGPRLGFRARQGQITLERSGKERIVAVRITVDRADSQRQGWVVTFDDITDLVQAQRTSAWADVARRIAHEIKNPLTPIQLSAERLKRRYGKRIEDDREVFDQCVDTIVRQVGDIGRMVNEFSTFARMPKPVIEERDLKEAVREGVFLQSVGHPGVKVETEFPEGKVIGRFDHRLIVQAVSNLVKNAAESIEQTTDEEREGEAGYIHVSIRSDADSHIVEIVDNGIGLPQEGRQRLLEPYMTTREKGTGLGLAIVGKIAEDHGGRVELLDASAAGLNHRGACVRFILAIHGPDTPDAGDGTASTASSTTG
ncbi:sensor histidine kinase NtrY-like [Amorphus orientalis]|uniref:histidine kinase n=1 Tax=Amorphus orientalis TaxID=649198 RepID=A0AAE3VQI9_9HYPH|nr:PAS domain-containing sensor histidine kinase [Amorphus orientalis]MDQ0315921.1 two-component system nitrogen regulation sensor histidine kinase NtrY [Amorphus orientalis]